MKSLSTRRQVSRVVPATLGPGVLLNKTGPGIPVLVEESVHGLCTAHRSVAQDEARLCTILWMNGARSHNLRMPTEVTLAWPRLPEASTSTAPPLLPPRAPPGQ